MSGPVTIVAFVLAIVIMIVAIARWKLHPFLALMIVWPASASSSRSCSRRS